MSDSSVSAIERKFDAMLAIWCADWGVGRDALTLECKRAWESTGLQRDVAWQRYGRDAACGSMWLCGREKAIEALQSCMFPSDGRHAVSRLSRPVSLAKEVAVSAIKTLIGKITVTFGGIEIVDEDAESGYIEECVTQYASGAIAVCIRIGHTALTVVFDERCVRNNIPAHVVPGPDTLRTTRRGSLLGNVPLVLQVELGTAQVEAGSLISLTPGDVICLESVVDRPLQVSNSEGQAMFSGYLAASGKSMVMEVVRNGR
jgi:flagellar motor switch/type III secretory pathway protein FliN